MFETAEIGQQVSNRDFKRRELKLWEELLLIQQELRKAAFPVIIDFGGVHGAGKHTSVNLLNKWMDARWIITRAYGAPTEEERDRPEFWRYWRDLPTRGEIGLYLSGRYSRPVLDYVYERSDANDFEDQITHIMRYERTLADDGALILKFWMHLSHSAQEQRLKSLAKDPLESWRVTDRDWKNWQLYDRFIAAAEQLISRTNVGYAPWHIVEGEDYNYRSLRVGELVRDALRQHLEKMRIRRELQAQLQVENHVDNAEQPENGSSDASAPAVTILETLDMSKSLKRRDYRHKMKELSARVNHLHRRALDNRISTILVFEGADAAGKGGIIRRLTSSLDATNYRVLGFAAPTDEEIARNYLWRFWRHLPPAGRMMVYDRSWYGRVLVERVESFATKGEWGRAYAEICEFEKQLTNHGVALVKFWVNITKDEQLNRFKAREKTPHKKWKLTDEDWRNRAQWDTYQFAAHDMIEKTSTASAPWHLIEGNDKLYARARAIEVVCDTLENAL